MTFGSRGKGASGEREAAKLLAEWWGKVEPGCQFARTPGSGGWGNPELRAGFKISGDLMTTAKRFPFSVEVKRREGWTWARLIAGKPSPVWEWWRQAQTQAREMACEPLLLFRHNRESWWAMLPAEYVKNKAIQCVGLEVRWRDGLRLLFSGVDYGSEVPVAFPASVLFDLDPEALLEKESEKMEGAK